MLCARVPTLAFCAPPLRPKISRSLLRSSSYHRAARFTVSMSAPTVEHVVLFKVKDGTDPTRVDSMVSGLNGLASLDQVLHLTAGPIHRTRFSPFGFTHFLHSRYGSKEDLSGYSLHPDHLSVVKESVLPICDDVMAVDWVADGVESSAVVPRPGSALRLVFLKVREGLGDAEKGQIVGVVKGVKDIVGKIDQMSVGENFSPERAKGYSIASIAYFPSLDELKGLDTEEETLKLHKEKVKDFVESVIEFDYVIPRAQSASL